MAPSLPWLYLLVHNTHHPIELSTVSDLVLHRFIVPSPLDEDEYFFCASSRGWIFACKDKDPRDQTMAVSLFNPVSGSLIHLPALPHYASRALPSIALLSSLPTDPNCAALLIDGYNTALYLCRVNGGNQWTIIEFPDDIGLAQYNWEVSAISCGGKFYCTHFRLLVIDPNSPTPTAEILEMDCSQLPKDTEKGWRGLLVGCNAEVFLVCGVDTREDNDLQVFRADIANKEWIRVHSLGGHVFFLCELRAFSMRAADVGCWSNSIVCMDTFNILHDHPCRLFDLNSGTWSDAWAPPGVLARRIHPYYLQWFTPSLDYINAPESG